MLATQDSPPGRAAVGAAGTGTVQFQEHAKDMESGEASSTLPGGEQGPSGDSYVPMTQFPPPSASDRSQNPRGRVLETQSLSVLAEEGPPGEEPPPADVAEASFAAEADPVAEEDPEAEEGWDYGEGGGEGGEEEDNGSAPLPEQAASSPSATRDGEGSDQERGPASLPLASPLPQSPASGHGASPPSESAGEESQSAPPVALRLGWLPPLAEESESLSLTAATGTQFKGLPTTQVQSSATGSRTWMWNSLEWFRVDTDTSVLLVDADDQCYEGELGTVDPGRTAADPAEGKGGRDLGRGAGLPGHAEHLCWGRGRVPCRTCA